MARTLEKKDADYTRNAVMEDVRRLMAGQKSVNKPVREYYREEIELAAEVLGGLVYRMFYVVVEWNDTIGGAVWRVERKPTEQTVREPVNLMQTVK